MAAHTVDVSDTQSERNYRNNPLSRKLAKLLESRLESDAATIDALTDLSEFFTDNNIITRRNLRGEIEKRNLAINDEFLKSFHSVKESLDAIVEDVDTMATACDIMVNQMTTTKSQTHELIKRTTKLQQEIDQLDESYAVAKAMIQHFRITNEEIQKLKGTGPNSQIDNSFFQALQRIQNIHRDCALLVRSSHSTRTGLEIMEETAALEECAYEHLYRWVQTECSRGSLITDESKLQRALCVLQNRPVLLRYAMDEYNNGRRSVLVRQFIDALTRPGHGDAKPLEFYAGDAVRYVSDMLTWLYEHAVAEREAVSKLLFSLDPAHVTTLTNQDANAGDGGGATDSVGVAIANGLAHITEGVARPLKVRVEQVTVGEVHNTVTLYRVYNALEYNERRMLDTVRLPPDAPLARCIAELKAVTQTAFNNCLNGYLSRLVESAELPPGDLGPTKGFQTAIQLIKQLVNSPRYGETLSSVAFSGTLLYDALLRCTNTLLHALCDASAAKLAPVDGAVFRANSGHALNTAMQACLVVSGVALNEENLLVDGLSGFVDTQLDALVAEQSRTIVASLGMSALMEAVNHGDSVDTPLSSYPGCDPLALQSALSKLDAFCEKPASFTIPQLFLLVSGTHRACVRRRSLERFCDMYARLERALRLPYNGFAVAKPETEPETAPNDLLVVRDAAWVKSVLLSTVDQD